MSDERPKGRVIVRLGSRRDPTVVYTVRCSASGVLSCDCPGFVCSKRRSCRHVEIVDVARQLAPEIRAALPPDVETTAASQ